MQILEYHGQNKIKLRALSNQKNPGHHMGTGERRKNNKGIKWFFYKKKYDAIAMRHTANHIYRECLQSKQTSTP